MYILILYYSRNGSTRKLARAIARGIEAAGIEARMRTVPPVSTTIEATEPPVPAEGDIYCSKEDLTHAAGLVLGSPTRFGNMAAALKYFIDGTAAEWLNGTLIGRPAGVFTSTGSMHGGQETTLLSMMLPLLHQGMVIVGAPYSINAVHTTKSGGSPYGPSHVALDDQVALSDDETDICRQFGGHFADIARRLAEND